MGHSNATKTHDFMFLKLFKVTFMNVDYIFLNEYNMKWIELKIKSM